MIEGRRCFLNLFRYDRKQSQRIVTQRIIYEGIMKEGGLMKVEISNE